MKNVNHHTGQSDWSNYAECVGECNLNTQEAGQCLKFKADLGYIVNSRAAWAKVETLSQNKLTNP